MKKIYLLISTIFITGFIDAQHLTNEWLKTIGGSGVEAGLSSFTLDAKALVAIDSDGNALVVTGSISNDGMITDFKGGNDCFITKYKQDGTLIWSKSFGGSGLDMPRDIIALDTGDFIIAGYTNSDNDDLTGNHGDGLFDGFLARFDKEGKVLWSKQYGGKQFTGGTGNDYFFSCIENSKGNIIAVGQTNSQDGDLTPDWLTGTPSFQTGWFVEVNVNTGAVITSKRVKAAAHNESNSNRIEAVAELTDGSGYYTLGNQTYSFNDIYWITKVDTNGSMVWETEVGKSAGLFVSQAAIVETYDGNAMIAVTTPDPSTVGYNGGTTDMWVIKLDASNGVIISEVAIGGSSNETAYGLIKDGVGKYYLCGGSLSSDGYMHGGNVDVQDNYIAYFTEAFDTLWTYRFGGTKPDAATDMALDVTGNLFVAGKTQSSDGFYSNSYGEQDVWVAKFKNDLTGFSKIEEKNDFRVYPNPASEIIYIDLQNIFKEYAVELFNILGEQCLVEREVVGNSVILNTSNLNNGVYFIKVTTKEDIFKKKIIIKH